MSILLRTPGLVRQDAGVLNGETVYTKAERNSHIAILAFVTCVDSGVLNNLRIRLCLKACWYLPASSHASAEQSAGAQKVGQAVTEMDQVTQQNAGLVHESAESASNLQLNANHLLEAMEVFKLPNADQNQHPGQAASTLATARSSKPQTSSLSVMQQSVASTRMGKLIS